MRCVSGLPKAQGGAAMSTTQSISRVLLCCLLSLTITVDAARPRSQRPSKQQHSPIYLPPTIPDLSAGSPGRDAPVKTFALRHIYHHGTQRYPELHRYLDVDDPQEFKVTDDFGTTYQESPTKLRVKPASWNVERLSDRSTEHVDRILSYSSQHGHALELPSSAWTVDPVLGPNITDKESILSFAKMAQDAYVPKFGSGEWMDVAPGFNYTDDFGWESDGLRGHIFADETNRTIVIGLKGTSPAVFDGADTTGNDKLNDNLFGSCCCAQGGQFMWKSVCDCMTSTYTCNNTCLVKALHQKSHYYWAVQDLYRNVTERYPNSAVWLTGHSLGGVVSSLLGLTYGLPTVTYEAYPDALAAARLGLPVPPGYRIGSHQSRPHLGIYHFGHTADPIYMGTCNGPSSFCTLAGYAFQGLCHTGKTCIFDTVGDFGWRVGIGTHKITNVIKDVLMKYDVMPSCEVDIECQDCFNWKFFESNGTESTTTSKASSTTARTRTETCKTPGWWGCLDESTTTGVTTTTTATTSSSSTSTCKTPGWFGCNDPTSTTSSTKSTSSTAIPAPTVTTTVATSTSTSKCKTPGWFGCNDLTSTSASTSVPLQRTAPPSTTITDGPALPSTTTSPPKKHRVCSRRHWYGLCKEWDVMNHNDL